MSYYYLLRYYESAFSEEIDVSGIVIGNTLNDVINKITKYYGEENIVAITVEYINDNDVLEMADLRKFMEEKKEKQKHE